LKDAQPNGAAAVSFPKRVKILPCFLILLGVSGRIAALEPAPTAEALDFFEKKIRPVLLEKCYDCHSQKAEKLKGALLIPVRIRWVATTVPRWYREVGESLLIQAIRYADKDPPCRRRKLEARCRTIKISKRGLKWARAARCRRGDREGR
jgi:hypothetical protein